MLGFTLTGRNQAHMDFQNQRYQILNMIVGYIQVLYTRLNYVWFFNVFRTLFLLLVILFCHLRPTQVVVGWTSFCLSE